nr:uncharacterized protein LOC109173053 [Ipomoea batatas]
MASHQVEPSNPQNPSLGSSSYRQMVSPHPSSKALKDAYAALSINGDEEDGLVHDEDESYEQVGEFQFTLEWKFLTAFLHIKVVVDITKPLLSKLKIKCSGGAWTWINFCYEKLLIFYFICGILGSTKRFCSKLFKRENLEDEKTYGVWLCAAGCQTQPVIK